MDEFFNFRADSVLIHTVSLLQAVQEMVVDGPLNFSFGPSIKDVSIFFSGFVIPPFPHVGVFLQLTVGKIGRFYIAPPSFYDVFCDNPSLILDQLCHFASV